MPWIGQQEVEHIGASPRLIRACSKHGRAMGMGLQSCTYASLCHGIDQAVLSRDPKPHGSNIAQ
jgi:hypothetical protein